MALDFEIEVAALGERGYTVMVRSPGGGEASAGMRLTPEMKALAVRAPEAVIASSATVRRGLSGQERPVRDLGSLLFRALVSEDVHSLLMTSRQQAAMNGEQLRIVLRISPPELACLPWEFLFDPGEDEYVCLSTPLIRRPQLLRPVRALGVTGPLRVLGMVASPGDQHELAADDERRRLAAAMSALAGRIELAWTGGQSWRHLNVDLRHGGPWHVLHFIGHGGFDRHAEEGVLILADEDGRSHALPASDLALLVEKHPSVRLVVLNACDTAQASALDAFSSVAGALLRRGIPSVLAMQFPITDYAAVEFSRTFYEGLADRLPVDAAVTEARHAVRITLPGTLEWGTPVLYLRSADGVIFDHAGEKPETGPAPPPPGTAGEPAAGDRLDRLYTEGLAAYHMEHWDEAVERFEAVAAHDRAYRGVGEKLLQARLKQRLAATYAAAAAAAGRGDWDAAINSFTSLLATAPEYGDAAQRLEDARRRKEIAALSAEAHKLYEAGKWAAVTAIGAKIAVLDPGFGDPDGVIAAARERSPGQARPRVTGAPMRPSQTMLLHTIPIVRHAGYVTFSPDGRILAVASGTTARLIDMTSGDTLITLVHPEFVIRGVAFSPDGGRIAIGSSAGTAIICDTATGSRFFKIRANRSGAQLQDLAFSPDGRLLVTAGEDMTAQAWDAGNGRRLQTLAHDGVVYDLAFSPDGRLLATASLDGTARVWDVARSRQLLTLRHVREVYGIAFSPDSRLLATGCRDKSARVWDLASGRKVLAVTHADAVLGVAFSPRGLLATAGADRTARVWDSATGGQRLALPHGGIVDRAVFSPDGRQLATVTRHECVQVWQLTEVGDE
ncbi:MAG: CHAT domain-containing protein [Actinobacteria bacterium]|nr:CHAT domain-containing protein [Actinomycetota bacterium]